MVLRMAVRSGLEEEIVSRHGEVHAGWRQELAVCRSESRKEDQDGDESGRVIAERLSHDFDADNTVFIRRELTHLGDRHHVKIRNVHEEVHGNHACNADSKRQRYVAVRLPNLRSEESDVYPSVIGPKRSEHSGEHRAEQTQRSRIVSV